MSRVSGGLHRFVFPMNGLSRFSAAPLFRKVTKIWRDTAAITSLEYALIGFPFFALIFGTFQLGLWYFYTCSVDMGVYHAARQLMTGQVQALGTASTLTPQTFTTGILCPQLPSFTSCSTSTMNVGLSVVSDFTQLVKQTTVTVPGSNPPVTYTLVQLKPLPQTYCTPKQGDVVYIQVHYKMPNIFGFFGLFHTTITSGTSVQIEQFPSTSGTFSNC